MKKSTSPILIVCLLTYLLACKSSDNSSQLGQNINGTIERIESFESEYVDARNIDVWLPNGYSDKEKYAVLYMHDGQMLFDSLTTWNKQEWGVDEVMTSLSEKGKIQKTIVVGIWNTKNRHAEYFPQKAFEMLPEDYQDSLINYAKRNGETSLFTKSVFSDQYLKFIVNELKPAIDNRYATIPDRDHTFVMGSSMGGLISMYAISEYPDVFGAAACLSTHWPGIFTVENNPIPNAFMNYLKQNLPGPDQHRIYFDYGTETLDALYEPFQMQADSVMLEKGYSDTNWKTLKFEGKDHSERAWNERLHIPLQFLLSKESK